jgi:SAM-dependent methyltransferase
VNAAEERLANDPESELWGEHRSRYRFAIQGSGVRDQGSGAADGQFPSGRRAAGLVADGLFADGQRALDGLIVLDVACGAGFGLQMLRQAGACPIGVDYDASALSEVRDRQAGARLLRGDATRLPLQDASIDLVVSFETLEHVPDAAALVAEIRRVLKPGGRLVLSTPNRRFGPPERHTGNPFHVREFTADELRDLLRESFEQVQLYGQRPTAAYRYVPFLMLEPHSEPSALAWKLLVRLPFGVKNRLALALSGRPVYPGEEDYRFVADACEGAHALVAVAR